MPENHPEPLVTQILLTRGQVAFVDICDSDLGFFKWRSHIKKSGKVYAVRTLPRSNGKRPVQHMHRIILERILGREILQSEEVDHVDNDGTNNRRNNLRLASRSQNNSNQGIKSNNKSGFKGISWDKRRGKWLARIGNNGKDIHLGYYSTPEQAHEAYCRAAKEIHGEFARYE